MEVVVSSVHHLNLIIFVVISSASLLTGARTQPSQLIMTLLTKLNMILTKNYTENQNKQQKVH